MVPACSGIAPEGMPFILLTGLAALVLACIKIPFLAILSLIFCIFSVYFFRDPERVVPEEAAIAVSPADGRVVQINVRKNPLLDEEQQCISIFMSVFNVHVNRVPVDCEVVQMRYFPGKFLNASLDKASEDNERCAWLLKESDGTLWCMVQIAGLIARRIVCRSGTGDKLKRGQRCGLIRFGSRVDVYLPKDYKAAVHIGETVVAGQTVLARR